MKLHIVGMGTAEKKDLGALARLPAFRKASRNMMLAHLAVEEACLGFALPAEATGLVLGSSFGELALTQEFLTTFATAGIARPLLFQNSLHSATSGFLSIHRSITGPTLTVSQRFFTGEACLETASLLLEASDVSICLVVAVESWAPTLVEPLKLNYPPGLELCEGAGALLLATDAGAAQLGARPLATLEEVETCQTPSVRLESGRFHDSDAIERLIASVRSGESVPLELRKPDGSASRLLWRSPAANQEGKSCLDVP
jgi:hypothetical protein